MWWCSRQPQRGSLLVATAWAVTFLTASAVTLASRVATLTQASQHLVLRSRAQRAAESAVARVARVVAAAPAMPLHQLTPAAWSGEADEPVLQRSYAYDDGRTPPLSLAGHVTDEERRINVNTAPPEVLSRLVQRLTDHDRQEADAIASAILDWRDADDYVRLDGAESSYYEDLPQPYRPKNGPVELLEELTLIKGMTADDVRRLRPFLTVYGPGQVNVMTASGDVLQALGLSDELVEQLLRFRAGEDEAAQTPDDPIFPAIEDFVQAFQESVTLPVQDEAQLGSLVAAGSLTTTDTVLRVTVRVAVGGRSPGRSFEAVLDRAGRILEWAE